MVTNPEQEPLAPTTAERLSDAAYAARDTVADGIRVAISGDRRGRIRRGLLYLVVVAGLAADMPVPGLLAIGLLMFTDQIVEVIHD